MTYDEIQKRIQKLEKEAAYQMALETFLDCAEVKVYKMKKPRQSERVINRYSANI